MAKRCGSARSGAVPVVSAWKRGKLTRTKPWLRAGTPDSRCAHKVLERHRRTTVSLRLCVPVCRCQRSKGSGPGTTNEHVGEVARGVHHLDVDFLSGILAVNASWISGFEFTSTPSISRIRSPCSTAAVASGLPGRGADVSTTPRCRAWPASDQRSSLSFRSSGAGSPRVPNGLSAPQACSAVSVLFLTHRQAPRLQAGQAQRQTSPSAPSVRGRRRERGPK